MSTGDTFNSAEIKRQARRIAEVSAEIKNYCGIISKKAEGIGNLVRSEDSNLAASWASISQSFSALSDSIDNAGVKLSVALDVYSNRTVENEQEAADNSKSFAENAGEVAKEIAELGNMD